LLGLAEIEATEMTDDEVLQKLWECDENLCRSELTDAQRARFTAERKKCYEIKHPETRHGANRHTRSRQVGDSNNRFTVETAARTGKSERSVQRARFTAERKKWYEIKHPETRHGATGNGREKIRQNDNSTSERFTASTAKRTGRSEASVQRDARRGEKIDPKALARPIHERA